MAQRRKLELETEADAIAEIERLRRGYARGGNWSLGEICWHCSSGMRGTLQAPATTQPTPEQARAQEFINLVATRGWPDQPFPAAQAMMPPADAGDDAVDEFVELLNQLAAFKHSHADHIRFFGPVPIGAYRKFILRHAAYHLSHLRPKLRDDLGYPDDDAVIADIRRLRQGYTQSGLWSLPQICWHLDVTTAARMKPGPFPPDTPEQQARRPVFEQVLASGRLPSGIVAPEPLVPAPDLDDSAIDACLRTLQQWKAFPGPVAPHRIFGTLTLEQGKRINRIHCANHLSYLSPL